MIQAGRRHSADGQRWAALGGRKALLLGEAADEGVEPLVLFARAPREVVPLGRGHRVGRSPGADGENAGKAVLGDRIAGLGGALEPGRRRRLVLGDAVAVEQADGVVDLRRHDAHSRRGGEPLHGERLVLADANPDRIELRKRVLGVGTAGFGRGGEELRGPRRIRLAERPFHEDQAEIVHRVDLALVRGLLDVVRAERAVLRDAAALHVHHAEGELGLTVAGIGGEPVPLVGLGEVLGHDRIRPRR